MSQDKSQPRTGSKRLLVGAVIAAFIAGLLIPSPLFHFYTQLGGRRIFLVRDTAEMLMPDGSVYEGTINAWNGRFDGYGVLKSADASYIGKWRNGNLIFGQMRTGDMTYEGRFDAGLERNGFGTARYQTAYIDSLRAAGVPDNEIELTYTGNWLNNLPNGLGRARMADSTLVFGHFRDGRFQPVPGAEFQPGEKVYGIDISHFQKNIDWDNLALFCDKQGNVFYDMPEGEPYMQPVLFVYIKATEGATFKDKTFATRMMEARRHGIARGAYHFLHVNSTAEKQLANFTETAVWRPGDLPPVLDVELESEILSIGAEAFRDLTYEWLKGVEEKMGVKPMIYTTDRIRERYLKPDARFDAFDYWTARYNQMMPINTDWTFWQFSPKGMVNGCDSLIDLDIYHKDLSAFTRYLQGLGN